MFEKLLIKHCSPTLAGIKVANMFMYSYDDVYDKLKHWNNLLYNYDLKLKLLSSKKNKHLIYIYRISMLKYLFNDESTRLFLEEHGYSNFSDIDNILTFLSSKFRISSFPHEIGVFLGYPLDDVKMFIVNKGKNYKYSGFWKVYSDEKSCIELFEKYKNCSSYLLSLFLKGHHILSLCA